MAICSYFFLHMWIKYIESASKLHSKSFFTLKNNYISMQSSQIFFSLAESLILLILSHRDHYPTYPLYTWEHGTESLEHLFGIARQIVPDFTYYEFYKIQQQISYRDKIIRQGNFDIKKDKTSAAGKNSHFKRKKFFLKIQS